MPTENKVIVNGNEVSPEDVKSAEEIVREMGEIGITVRFPRAVLTILKYKELKNYAEPADPDMPVLALLGFGNDPRKKKR